jgi:hypothetical protein
MFDNPSGGIAGQGHPGNPAGNDPEHAATLGGVGGDIEAAHANS